MPYCLGFGFAMGLGHVKQEWRKERSSDWYDRIVLQTFTDEQWVENFRMTRQTFNKVCRVLKPDLSPMENTVRDAIDVQKQVALTIYWLATPTEYRTIGNLFGVAKSTALKCIHIQSILLQLLKLKISHPVVPVHVVSFIVYIEIS